MYTVKHIVNGDRHFFDCEKITVGDCHSTLFKEAIKVLDESPALTAGDQDNYNAQGEIATTGFQVTNVTKTITYDQAGFAPKENVLKTARLSDTVLHPNEAIGVIAVETESVNDVVGFLEFSEVSYTFVYPGEELYLLNQTGKTIDLIR